MPTHKAKQKNAKELPSQRTTTTQQTKRDNEPNKNGSRQQAVWQNGGFSAKFNGSSSIEHLCKTEHLRFDFRHFAKLLER
ncbi:MAG: hypothetical protein JST62_08080 [Bacteroidetes bacterium]|nr:hypothetical protein [Bacteroidota bacterium]